MSNETGEETTGQAKILGEGIHQLHETITDLQAQLAAERSRSGYLMNDEDATKAYRQLMISQAGSLGTMRLIERLGVDDQTKTNPALVSKSRPENLDYPFSSIKTAF